MGLFDQANSSAASRPSRRPSPVRVPSACVIAGFVILCGLQAASGWQQWTWNTDGPGPRDGHSLRLLGRSVYLFGGRSDDVQAFHRPTTYEIENVNGSLGFRSYDQQPVRECAAGLTQDECYNTTIGVYWNDVWRYDLDCDRYADLGCSSQGWTLVKPHANLGGCRIFREELVCSHPSERHDHGAALFPSGELLVWGGFSWKCDDYCDDEWMLDVQACRANASLCNWQEEVGLGGRPEPADAPGPTEGGLAPGKRWRFATAEDGQGKVYQFGGQRLWHGFATANSAANRWANTDSIPFGGLLDDLWSYDRSTREWTQVLPKESCYEAPGRDWEHRNDRRCTITWPSPRASAALAFQDGKLYLHGGFNAPLPYPHVDGRGASTGTGRAASDGPAPHPSHPYYLQDLWELDLQTGLWKLVEPELGEAYPAPRRDHMMLATSHALLLFGGYGDNFHFGDTWLFNASTRRWLQKETFVHALFPSNCTSDVLKLPSGEDFVLQQSVRGEPTRHTLLDGKNGRASEAVQVLQPRRQAPGWDGCRDRLDGREDLPAQLQWLQPSQRYGYAAVFAPDLPVASRDNPFGLDGIALLYGGVSLLREDLAGVAVTRPSAVVGDFWQLDVTSCPNNCSGSGDCWYGFCYCHDGYYGLDCSNASCPGDYCYYDPHTHEQICSHCCHAVHEHSEEAPGDYVLRERKVACDARHPGESHGICDGFGQCQCAPPYVGHDCSIRDCPEGCSGRGACSLEFPVARCMCDPGWAGDSCQEQLCLNNCSWPNGYCDSGTCVCTMNPNPFNRSIDFEPFAGEDCSFLVPFAGAARGAVAPNAGRAAFAVLAAAALAVLVAVGSRGDGGEASNCLSRASRRGRLVS